MFSKSLGAILLATVSVTTAAAGPPVSQYPPPMLGVFVRPSPGGGMRITEVLSGSLASDLGLWAGDTIITVNGQLVSRLGDIPAALALSVTNVEVVFISNGRYYQVSADIEYPPLQAPLQVQQKLPQVQLQVKHVQRKEVRKP